jgi:hypothetical protein
MSAGEIVGTEHGQVISRSSMPSGGGPLEGRLPDYLVHGHGEPRRVGRDPHLDPPTDLQGPGLEFAPLVIHNCRTAAEIRLIARTFPGTSD